MLCLKKDRLQRIRSVGFSFFISLTSVRIGRKVITHSFVHLFIHSLWWVTLKDGHHQFLPLRSSCPSIKSWVCFPLQVILGWPVTCSDQWNVLEVMLCPWEAALCRKGAQARLLADERPRREGEARRRNLRCQRWMKPSHPAHLPLECRWVTSVNARWSGKTAQLWTLPKFITNRVMKSLWF